MRKLTVFAILIVIFGTVGIAQANLIFYENFNGGLSGWTSSGNVSVLSAADFPANRMTGNYASLGLTAGNGLSVLSHEFVVTGLSQVAISFDWFFNFADKSPQGTDTFAALATQQALFLPITFDVLLSQNSTTKDNVLSGKYTGVFDLLSIPAWVPGTAGAISFSLFEPAWNLGSSSFAGVDNVEVTNPNSKPVPEPSTLLLLGSALVGLSGIAWRQHRKN